MARYWDYPRYLSDYWANSSTSSTNATNISPGHYTTNSTSTTSRGYYAYITVVKEYIVSVPDHWSEADKADLTYLINDATNTGFKIKMWMTGDIQITDPNIEKRTLEDFVPLLLSYADQSDRQTIRDFFASHPPLSTPTS